MWIYCEYIMWKSQIEGVDKRLVNPYLEKSNKHDLVSNYYKFVDCKNIEEYRKIYDLFSNTAIYDRSWILYSWKNEIIDFFESRFSILNIEHYIENIRFFDNWDIFVTWSFNWYKNSEKVSWNFTDIFEINNWKIMYRKTNLLADEWNSKII